MVSREEVAAEPAPGNLPWVPLLVIDDRRRHAEREIWKPASFGVELASSVEDGLDGLSVMTPSLVMVDDRSYRSEGR